MVDMAQWFVAVLLAEMLWSAGRVLWGWRAS